eukprot:992338-Prymnesium_polylepis.1
MGLPIRRRYAMSARYLGIQQSHEHCDCHNSRPCGCCGHLTSSATHRAHTSQYRPGSPVVGSGTTCRVQRVICIGPHWCWHCVDPWLEPCLRPPVSVDASAPPSCCAPCVSCVRAAASAPAPCDAAAVSVVDPGTATGAVTVMMATK